MPHYLLVHEVHEYPGTQDAWVESWRQLRARACGEARWLHSFFDAERNHLYCEWDAPDTDLIMACFSHDQLASAPILEIREIAIFDPSWLDEPES
jgi:hypothetical protein